MTSVHTSCPGQIDTLGSVAPDCSVRRSLEPSGGFACGAVDAAWWTRSTDPAIELVALDEELGVRCAQIRCVALNVGGWDSARQIQLASGRRVAVGWFRISVRRWFGSLGLTNQRIDLLLVSDETTPAIANRALTIATQSHDPETTASGEHARCADRMIRT